MFSLKLIEKKASKGRKKKATDISPHPLKKMKIDHDCSLSDSYFKPKTINKHERKRRMTDVCHPIKKMKVNMWSSTDNIYPAEEVITGEINAEDSLAGGNQSTDQITTSHKKQRGNSKGRYFNQIHKQMKYYINDHKMDKQNKESYEKLLDDNNVTNATDNNGNTGYEKLDDNNISTTDNDNTGYDGRDACAVMSTTKLDDMPIIDNASNHLEKDLSEKYLKKHKGNVSSNYEESSDGSSNEEDWCPWKSFDESKYINESSGPESESKSDQNTSINSVSKSGSKKRKHVNSIREESIAKIVEEKMKVVGTFESVRKVDENTVLVVLKPGRQLFLHGVVQVSLVAGSAKILGYSLKKKEKVTMYSTTSYSLLSIDSIEGEDIATKEFSFIRKYNLVSGEQSMKKVGHAVIIELKRHSSTLMKFLPEVGWKNLFPHQDKTKFWSSTIGALPILPIPEQCKNFSFLRNPSDWQLCIDKLKKETANKKGFRVLVCGGKSVGKSTFSKLLLNNILSCQRARERGVLILDLDPGQPELGLPSCITLALLSRPLLGQPMTHIENEDGIQYLRKVLLGSVSVENILHEYFKVVHSLVNAFYDKHSHLPLVVNTMGWTHHIGLDIIIDLLRIVQPTNVIQIKSENKRHNFLMDLKCNLVNESNHGINTKMSASVLEYEHVGLLSGTSIAENTLEGARAKEKRKLRFLSYFSTLWDSKEDVFNVSTCKKVIKVSWLNIGLHVYGRHVPRSHILLALNASMVALAKIDPKYLESVGEDLPKFLSNESITTSHPECVGWGIIQGIDPDSKELQILTPLSEDTMKKEVNVVIMPETYLPETLITLFSSGKGPYCQLGERSGAAKLHVGRKVKTFRR